MAWVKRLVLIVSHERYWPQKDLWEDLFFINLVSVKIIILIYMFTLYLSIDGIVEEKRGSKTKKSRSNAPPIPETAIDAPPPPPPDTQPPLPPEGWLFFLCVSLFFK